MKSHWLIPPCSCKRISTVELQPASSSCAPPSSSVSGHRFSDAKLEAFRIRASLQRRQKLPEISAPLGAVRSWRRIEEPQRCDNGCDEPRDQWPQTPLHDGDQLEIVHFVGGGSEYARLSPPAHSSALR